MRASVSPSRVARHLGPPLVVVFAAAYWVVEAVRIARYMPLGGDHGIFQYIAWSMRRGERMYEHFREVNGPGTAMVHLLFQRMGAARDEVLFRSLDLIGNGLAFAIIGACLPGLLGTRRDPARAWPASWWARLGWALASATALMASYLHLGFWGTAQRESFAMWFLLPSLGLTLHGLGTYRGEDAHAARRRQRIELVVAGALSSLVWFFKPTFALFSVVQGLAIVTPTASLGRRERTVLFTVSALGSATMCALALLPFADLGLWWSYLLEARELYRFVWNGALTKIWSGSFGAQGAQAVAIALLGTLAVGQRIVPARMLCVLWMPLAAAVHVTLQHKGFQYHFHPLLVLTRVAWLAITVALIELSRRSVRDMRLAGALALVPTLALALHTAETAYLSPTLKLAVLHDPSDPAYVVGSPAYYKLFKSRHTPFLEQHEAARYLKEHTRKTDRIQVYGRDPWVLYLARRKSATPYLYATDLNVEPALEGSGLVVPDAAERKRIREIGEAHDADLLSRLRASPPAKIVFIDGEGLMPMPNAAANFRKHVPQSGAWVFEHYEPEIELGPIRIYGRMHTDAVAKQR